MKHYSTIKVLESKVNWNEVQETIDDLTRRINLHDASISASNLFPQYISQSNLDALIMRNDDLKKQRERLQTWMKNNQLLMF